MSAPALSVRLEAGYRKQRVLTDLHFELFAGERLGLVGESGAGKSTMVLALLGLLSQRGGWAKGEVLLGGRNILALSKGEARSLRGRSLALVPQSSLEALNPALSLQTHFEQSWKAHCPKSELFHQRTRELLERVALPSTPEFLRRKPGQISVGQAQRCTLALALLHRPSVVIADEPTSALDPLVQIEIINLLREFSNDFGTALLFVSHDLLSVLRLCDSVAVLSRGSLRERVPVAALAEATDPTLKMLLGTLPVSVDVLLQHMPSTTATVTPIQDDEAQIVHAVSC